MAAGDAQATRRRLLDAAAAEFARHGIAGARVDRIAAAAKSNKAQIYHYFGSKDDLFDAVFHELVVERTRAVPIDADDLPGYAGRLFDGYEERPDIARLATWHRLERAADRPPLPVMVDNYKDKIDKIAAAQQAGRLSTTFAAADLLALVIATAATWTIMNPELAAASGRPRSRARRRRVVVAAVEALLAA